MKLSKMSNAQLSSMINNVNLDFSTRIEAEAELYINRKKETIKDFVKKVDRIANLFENNSLGSK